MLVVVWQLGADMVGGHDLERGALVHARDDSDEWIGGDEPRDQT